MVGGGKDVTVNEPREIMTQDNSWRRDLVKRKDGRIALVDVGQICSRYFQKQKCVSEDFRSS